MQTKILVFKAAPEDVDENTKDLYQKCLEDLNFVVKIVNVIQFNYKNLDVLKMKLIQPDEYSAVVFGSPRCVRAVANAVDRLPEQWRSGRWRCFAVGEATSRLALNLLSLNAEGSDTGNGQALAPIIVKHNLKKPVLMPVGNLSRETIADSLKSSGVAVDAVQVYETAPHAQLRSKVESLAIDEYKAIVFFSPSGVNSTVPILRDLHADLDTLKFVSIGPTTEKALLEHGLTVSATASKPTPEALAEAVSALFA